MRILTAEERAEAKMAAEERERDVQERKNRRHPLELSGADWRWWGGEVLWSRTAWKDRGCGTAHAQPSRLNE